MACCACSYPTVAAAFQCTTDCTHEKKSSTLKMGPFKTVGGLHASAWQIAIFYKGPGIKETRTARVKSRLGISGGVWGQVLEHMCARLPPPPPVSPESTHRWVFIIFILPFFIFCLVLQKLCREKLRHSVNITHLTNSKFALKRQLLRLTFAK